MLQLYTRVANSVHMNCLKFVLARILHSKYIVCTSKITVKLKLYSRVVYSTLELLTPTLEFLWPTLELLSPTPEFLCLTQLYKTK